MATESLTIVIDHLHPSKHSNFSGFTDLAPKNHTAANPGETPIFRYQRWDLIMGDTMMKRRVSEKMFFGDKFLLDLIMVWFMIVYYNREPYNGLFCIPTYCSWVV